MNRIQPKEHADSISEAVSTVRDMSFTNGMATEPVSVEREHCYLRVTRKCGAPTRPEILLFKAVPKYGYEIRETATERLESDLTDALGLYGDIQLRGSTRYENGKETHSIVIENVDVLF